MSNRCALCGAPSAAEGLNRISSLDVCDVCTHGDLSYRLANRGWQSSSREWVTENDNGATFHVEVSLVTRSAPPIQATFARNNLLQRGLSIFGGGVKTGDPTFDDLIAVMSKTKEFTRAFLQLEGPQNAVMELVGEGGKVFLNGGQLQCKAVSRETLTAQPFHLQACVLMHHLEMLDTRNDPFGQ